nr:hypothetical protein BAR15_130039 [Bartonella sp. AR 15-3]
MPLESPASVPTIAPDHVLLGENLGANLGPPNARPPKYAAISVLHTTVNKKITLQKPNVLKSRKKDKAPTGKDAYINPPKVQPAFPIDGKANNTAKIIKTLKSNEAGAPPINKKPKRK